MCGCGRIGFADLLTDGDDDPDADGVILDNCPLVWNPNQEDEDRDGLGDLCDACPPFVDNADPDNDKVGGPCDPNPTIPGDAIAHFAGFGDMPADLELVGSWSVANGKLSVVGSQDELTGATWTISGSRESVFTRVTIDEMFGTDRARPVGVVHRFNAPTSDGTTCVFGINPSDLQVCALANNRTTSAIVLRQTPVAVGDTATFISHRDANQYTCFCEPHPEPLVGNNMLATPNRVGLHARSASASFDWVLVVTSP